MEYKIFYVEERNDDNMSCLGSGPHQPSNNLLFSHLHTRLIISFCLDN